MSLLPKLALASWLMWSPPQVQTTVSHVGGWTLRMERNSFSGASACSLTNHKAAYRHGVLVLQLGEAVDSADAVYRIDEGAPISTRDDELSLALQGIAVHADSLLTASGGLVRIPGVRLLGARSVRVQANSRRAPVAFAIAGLGEALDRAKAAGCAPEAFS